MHHQSLVLSRSQPLRYGSFLYLYVMQGIPSGFALTAVTNYLTAHGLTPQALGTFGAIVGLPWGFKFIWGPLVDRYQASAMGRRRPWILASQIMALLASLALLFVDDPVAELGYLTGAFALHGVFASLQDVSVDALVITIVPPAERGRANAFMKGGMVLGQALGAAGLAFMIQQGGFHQAALLQSVVLLILTGVTFFIREQPGDALLSLHRRQPSAVPNQYADPEALRPGWSFGPLLRELGRAMATPHNLLIFGAIALVFISERLFQRVYFIHLIQTLGWSDTSVSVLTGSYGTLLALSLSLLGGWLADRVGAQRMLLGVALMMAALHVGFSMSASLWTNSGVATAGIVGRQALEPIFSIAALPTLMALCRRGIEGAQFAFYMALGNQADVAGIFLSGQLLPFFSAPTIGVACGVTMGVASGLVWLAFRQTEPLPASAG